MFTRLIASLFFLSIVYADDLPRDWVRDRSFNFSGTAVFSCPEVPDFGPASWFKVLLRDCVVPLPTSYGRFRVNGSSLHVIAERLPNVGIFCARWAGVRKWVSRVAILKEVARQRPKFQRVTCGSPFLFSCSRWRSWTVKENSDSMLVVYAREDSITYSLTCHSCKDAYEFGPLLLTSRRGHHSVTIQKSWHPHFLASPRVVTYDKRVLSSPPALIPLLLLVSAASNDLSRLPAGSALRLACLSVRGGSTRWLKDGKPLVDDRVSKVKWGLELKIEALRFSDEGTFSCVRGVVKRSVRVSLTGTLFRDIVNGELLTLSCCHAGGVRWRFRHDGIRESRRSGSCSRLEVRQVGNFSCEADAPPRALFSFFNNSLLSLTPQRHYFPLRKFIITPRRREVNKFDPSLVISGVENGRVSVDLEKNGGFICKVMVTDKDTGDAGKVESCRVNCQDAWKKCPTFEVVSRERDWLLGRISTNERDSFEVRRLSISCHDVGRPPRIGTSTFLVSSCRHCGGQDEGDEEATRMVMQVTELQPNDTQVFAEKVENATKKAKEMTLFQLQLSIKTTDALIDKANASGSRTAVATTVLGSLTNVINASSLGKLDGGKTDVRSACERLSSVLNGSGGGEVIHSASLAVGAVTPNRSSSHAVRFLLPTSGSAADVRIASDDVDTPVRVSVTIDQRRVNHRIAFNLYPTPSLFPTSHDVSVASPIVAARANFDHDFSGTRVRLLFNVSGQPDTCSGRKLECAFFNVSTRRWETDGCNWATVDGVTRCRCSHLTNFALILRLDDSPIPPVHQRVLSVLSILLLVLSCAALALTALVHASYIRRKLNRARTGHGQQSSATAVTGARIHIGFCATLMTSLLFFLMMGDYRTPGTGCEAVGAIHHFLLLAVFAWSVMEGAHIYSAIIHVAIRTDNFSRHIRRFFLKAAIVAWGLPAVFVVVLFCATHSQAYGLCRSSNPNSESLCFFKGRRYYYFAFLLPICCCLLLNIIILGLLGFVLRYRVGVNSLSERKKRKSKRKIIGFLGVFLVLNGTWIVGFLNAGPLKILGSYLFVIINGLQGTLVFFCYCIFQDGVRNHMRRHIPCLRWIPSAEDTSAAATSSAVYTPRPSVASVNFYKSGGEQNIALVRKYSSQTTEISFK